MARQRTTAELSVVISEALSGWQRPHRQSDEVVEALYQICNSTTLAAIARQSIGYARH
jgi:hypothetical protein